jgi:hypothetical protein
MSPYILRDEKGQPVMREPYPVRTRKGIVMMESKPPKKWPPETRCWPSHMANELEAFFKKYHGLQRKDENEVTE